MKDNNKILTEKELVEYLVKEYPEYHRYEYQDMFKVLCSAIQEALLDGYSVRLNKIGRFHVVDVAEKSKYNMTTGALERVPAKKKLKFSFNHIFKKNVNSKINGVADESQNKAEEAE